MCDFYCEISFSDQESRYLAFLAKFVNDTPWAHLDIAGKAWSDKATATVPKGGPGYGVRLLKQLIDNWQDVSRDSDVSAADGDAD